MFILGSIDIAYVDRTLVSVGDNWAQRVALTVRVSRTQTPHSVSCATVVHAVYGF